MKAILDLTMGLVEQNVKNGSQISTQVRQSIEKQLSSLNTTILGEYFAKTEVSRKLFTIAIELENLSMQKDFSDHSDSSIELRALLLCLIDYWEFDRTTFLERCASR